MYPFPKELSLKDRNKSASYLPIRNKGNDFIWEIIAGKVLGHALRLKASAYQFEQFENDCKTYFLEKLDDPSFWLILDEMYFKTHAIYKISPLFLLLKNPSEDKSKAANQRMIKLFDGFLSQMPSVSKPNEKLNFIECNMLNILLDKLEPEVGSNITEQPYLPHINKVFLQDMSFLLTRPRYLLQELTNILKMYAFIYCSQLALNIRSWKNGEPSNKPLYFILDTEKASSERVKIKFYGHKMLLDESKYLFPLLSALEVLQYPEIKRPLWKVYQDAINYPDHTELVSNFNEYLQAFIDNRELSPCQPANSVTEAFEQFNDLAIQQFDDLKTYRKDINGAYVNEFEKQICGDFIQSRGRSGSVLVLKQDQLLLLTNIAIGEQTKLRLSELITSFEQRGFYLDNQSQKKLVSFYERMGNVERMSDSGDAVYVRKTI